MAMLEAWGTESAVVVARVAGEGHRDRKVVRFRPCVAAIEASAWPAHVWFTGTRQIKSCVMVLRVRNPVIAL